jgi:hypothetical protein
MLNDMKHDTTEHSSLTFEAFLDYLDSTNEFGEELRPLAFKVIGRIINKFNIN